VRWWIVAFLFIPAIAFARPKIAIAPLEGDDDGKVTAIVAEEASQHAAVLDPKPTQDALDKLGFSDAKSKKAQKKLRSKLKVDVIIYGDVSGNKTKHVTLNVSARGQRASTIELTFKGSTMSKFRKELRDELGKQLAGTESEAQEEDEDHPHSDDHPKSEGSHSVRRPYQHHDDDDSSARHPVTESAVWLDAGGAGLHRSLTYDTAGAASPPLPVGTASFSGELEAELYPAAFDSLASPAAGFGIAASAAKTVGLSIKVPGSSSSASINQSRFTVGARYRFHFGQTTLAAGVSYWKQSFSADKTSLPMGTTLDMPNCDYSAVAPGAVLRIAASPTIGVSLALDIPLILASGEITTGTSFGQATVIAGTFEGAVDVALAPHYGLRFAALYDQLNFSFKAPQRGVTGATDRTEGLLATVAIIY
jgi:hypothetical protein